MLKDKINILSPWRTFILKERTHHNINHNTMTVKGTSTDNDIVLPLNCPSLKGSSPKVYMHYRSLYLNNQLCFLHILKCYYWPTKHRFHCPLLSQPFTQHEAFNLDISSIFQPNKIGTCSHPCFSHMIMAKRDMSK